MVTTAPHGQLIEEFAGFLARDNERAAELFTENAELHVKRGDWSVSVHGRTEIEEFLGRLPTAFVFHVVTHGGDDDVHRASVEVIGEKRGLIRERWQYTVNDGLLQTLSVVEQ